MLKTSPTRLHSGCHGLLYKHVEVEMNATKLQA